MQNKKVNTIMIHDDIIKVTKIFKIKTSNKISLSNCSINP